MKPQNKSLLFSVIIHDCDVQTFRAGGKGGQHQNMTDSGVRIIHRESGAVGECRETRSQHVNKQRAFVRMTETERFKKWHRVECARRMGRPSVAEQVRREFTPRHLKIETLNENSRWQVNADLAPTEEEIENLLFDQK